MDYQAIQNILFSQLIDTVTGGITVDIVTVMTAGVSILCIIIALNLLSGVLRDTEMDAVYDKYNSKYGDKPLSRSAGRAENRRQAKSFEKWLSDNKPESSSDYFRKRNY